MLYAAAARLNTWLNGKRTMAILDVSCATHHSQYCTPNPEHGRASSFKLQSLQAGADEVRQHALCVHDSPRPQSRPGVGWHVDTRKEPAGRTNSQHNSQQEKKEKEKEVASCMYVLCIAQLQI